MNKKFKEGTVHVVIPQTKKCSKCGTIKPASAFDRRHKRTKYGTYVGLYSRCIECKREDTQTFRKNNIDHCRTRSRKAERKRRLVRYGISEDDFYSILHKQGDRCAICGTSQTTTRGWHIDHSHKTGSVRGILCHHCNLLLGNAKDDPVILKKAIKYLHDKF